MPQIADVEWEIISVGDQVEIIFEVTETEQIESVEFVGNKHIKAEDLRKELGFEEGDFLDRYLVGFGAASAGPDSIRGIWNATEKTELPC